MIALTYLLNVALHAAILSFMASIVLLLMRQARHRSVVAIAGLLAVGFLPWVSAFHRSPGQSSVSSEIESHPMALPDWTVITVPSKEPEPTSPATPPAATQARLKIPNPLQSVIIIWAIGTLAGLALLVNAWLRVQNWRNSLEPIDDARWTKLLKIFPTPPNRKLFLFSKSTSSPCVSGFLRPRIVLPDFLLAASSSPPLGWAVRHELSHLKAGDSRWVVVFSVIRSLYWWNPFVHHLVLRWADAREQLCDIHAVGAGGSRVDYGQFLVAMADRIPRPYPLTVAMTRRRHAQRLKSRIVSLLDAQPKATDPVGKRFYAASLAGFIGIAVLVSVLKIRAEEPAGQIDPAVETSVPADKPPTIPVEIAPVQEAKTTQLKLTTKFVASPKQFSLPDGKTLDDARLQLHMRKLAHTKGVDFMSAPSVTLRFGESAKIEVVREVPGSLEQISKRNPDAPTPVVGIEIDFGATFKEGLAELKSSAKYSFLPDVLHPMGGVIPDHSRPLPAGANPDKIRILKSDALDSFAPRMTIVRDLGETEPGKFLQIFITVHPLNATGRPSVSFTDDTPLAVE
jgi:beta-lactamase regulating signal transducer with metallopeptidase domain